MPAASSGKHQLGPLRRALTKFRDFLIERPSIVAGTPLRTIPCLLDVFWLDLGQLLYALSRADTVTNALAPLHHVTFSTRDFWTEISIADQGRLLDGKWHSIGQANRR